jgi:hypothetical protein
MSEQDPPTLELQRKWGVAIAQELSFDFPCLVSPLIEGGVICDPTPFIQLLKNSDTASTAPIRAVFECIDRYTQYREGQVEAMKSELDNTKNEYMKLSKQLATLTEKITGGMGGASRRQTVDPDKFSGDEKDIAKRQVEYINWRSKIGRNITTDDKTFDSDFKQLQYGASMLTGSAYRLFQIRFDMLTSNRDEPANWPWKNLDGLFTDLNALYATMDLSKISDLKFKALWMKAKPYPQFLAEFQSLGQQAGKTKSQMVDELKQRVSRELAVQLKGQVTVPGPEEFEKWAALFQALWDRIEEDNYYSMLRDGKVPGQAQQRQIQNQHQQTQNTQQPATAQDAGDPMQLDAFGRQRPSKEQCRQQGLCFYCRKPGCSIGNCPEKAANDARFGNQTRQSRGNFQSMGRDRGSPQGRSSPLQTNWNPSRRGYQGNQFPRPQLQQLRQIEMGGYVPSDSESSADMYTPAGDSTASHTPFLSDFDRANQTQGNE